MLDEVGLIHMNGRIYDPAVGRFISADPDVPYPTNIQSYNRYSYTRNNPLIAIDPSGFEDCYDTGNAVRTMDASDSNSCVVRAAERDAIERDNRATLGADPNSTDIARVEVPGRRDSVDFHSDLSMFLDALPYAGSIKSGFEVVAGYDPITNDPGHRGAAAFGLVAGLVPGGKLVLKAPWWKAVMEVGRKGENQVRKFYNIGEKGRFTIKGRDRVADEMTATTLTEIKNVKSLSFTSQLRDYADYAKETKRAFHLWTRSDTTFTPELQKAIDDGFIVRQIIPGT